MPMTPRNEVAAQTPKSIREPRSPLSPAAIPCPTVKPPLKVIQPYHQSRVACLLVELLLDLVSQFATRSKASWRVAGVDRLGSGGHRHDPHGDDQRQELRRPGVGKP